MKTYVFKRFCTVLAGTELRLSPAQVARRAADLAPVKRGVWRALAPVNFKAGESVGIADLAALPKHVRQTLAPERPENPTKAVSPEADRVALESVATESSAPDALNPELADDDA